MTDAELLRLVLALYCIVTAWIATAGLYSAALVWHDRERRSARLFVGLCLAAGWPLAPVGAALLVLDWWRRRRRGES